MLIAYTKNANVAEVVRTDLPEVDLLEADLRRLLPVRRCASATPTPSAGTRCGGRSSPPRLVNQMVNLSGISFDHRMTEDTGASVVDVTRAWLVAREVLDFAELWAEIDALTGVRCRSTSSSTCSSTAGGWPSGRTLWLLRHRRPPIDVAAAVAQFKPGLAELAAALEPVLVGRMADVVRSVEASRLTAGVPERPRRAGGGVAAAAHRLRPRRAGRRPTGRDVDRARAGSSGRCSTAST